MKIETNKTNNAINAKNCAFCNAVSEIENDALTKREREILELISNGLTSKEISETLFISYDTVETHRKNIIENLKAKNATNAVAIALRNGLIK